MIRCRLLVALLCAAAAPAAAETSAVRAAAKPAQETAFGERSLINVGNVSMWFQRDGWSGNNPLTLGPGTIFPRSTGPIVFQDGFVWGGRVFDGDPQLVRVGGQTYEIGTVPGAILAPGVAEDPADPSVRIYRVRRDYRTADLRLDAAEQLLKGLDEVTDADVAAVRAQFARDWLEWPAHKGAPFYDRDGDGRYTPRFDAAGAPVLDGSADEPGAANADMVAWFVVNDLDEGATTNLYGSRPIGLEVQMTFWAYARTDALGDAIFKRYRVIYEGTASTPDSARIEDLYFAQWSDADVGAFGDDFAGSDVELSLGFAYNGRARDSDFDPFGLAPPAVGYDFLQGPIVPVLQRGPDGQVLTGDDGEPLLDEQAQAIFDFRLRPGYRNLPMTSFVYFAAGSPIDDPEFGSYAGTLQWYNLLQGFQPLADLDDPVPYTNAVTGLDTRFALDGDPTTATGWIDGVPLPAGDRRIVLDTGPVTMALGDTQEVVVALLGASGSSRLRSLSKLKFSDRFVQDAYNSFFRVPSPPSSPSLRAAALDGAVVLDWGWEEAAVAATEGAQTEGFAFEGYNVYQLPSAEAPRSQAVKLATFDLDNGVTSILGIDLDESSGLVLEVPLQTGSDFGVRRQLQVRTDAVRGGPLVNGQRYYFAVTAYNRALASDAAVTSLESPLRTVVVTPQEPVGRRLLAEAGAAISGDHTAGGSDGTVAATVVDPTRTTGDSYRVAFESAADGGLEWHLTNLDRGETLAGGRDQQGTPVYVASEGFEVRVSGPPGGMKDWDVPSGDLWYTPEGGSWEWGAEGFDGAITGDPNSFWIEPTSVTPDRLRTVELRFSSVVESDGEEQFRPLDPGSENVSQAYRYVWLADLPPPAPEDLTTTPEPWDFSPYIVRTEGPGDFLYQDRRPICLSAWDVDSTPPRRLEVGFVENNDVGGLLNGAYGPPFFQAANNIDPGGPLEWLVVFDLDYTDPENGQNSDILLRNGLLPNSAAGDEILPIMWIVFAERAEADRFPRDGDRFRMIANHVNTEADQFTFTVPGSTASQDLLRQDVKRINVFPNPYYGANEAETARGVHFVTFSHLPPTARIRIFDLSGTLVRVLDKSGPDPFLRWDLTNDDGLPVASGLYLAHVELPGLGTSRVLKIAVVLEQQFLEYF